ncbi:MAG: HAD family hydrolase [Actinomycetes bacterium]
MDSPRIAAFFDLDKTIIARSSTLAFSRPFYRGGLLSRSALLKSAYAQFVYLFGGADHDRMEQLRVSLSSLVKDWDVAQVRQIVAEALHELIDPLVYDEAVALIEEHHAAGHHVVIVSTSGVEVVDPIGRMLGADEIVATRMAVADGRYTGEIDFYAYGQGKADAVTRLAAQHGYVLADCFGYSDSVTDLPMLEAVGHPYAVNPDRALRREAASRGWPVLDFSRPVRIRSRVPGMRSRPVLTTVALVGAAGAAGMLWLRLRHPGHPVVLLLAHRWRRACQG